MNGGKRAAQLVVLRLSSNTVEDYDACVQDMQIHGYCMMKNGTRIDPASVRNGGTITFHSIDEDESQANT